MAFFTPATNDQSILYLAQLFGTMNGIILPSQQATTFSGQQVTFGNETLLSTMFQTFNSAILVVGALIVFYVTVVGILKTAQEGEFLGRNWNSLWIPVRMVLGIAALVPTGIGYSAIQLVMMWVIVQGIGAADSLWTSVVNYVAQTGSPYVQIQVPSVNSSSTMETLFQSLTCEMAAAQQSTNPSGISGGGYFCKDHPKHSFCTGNPQTNINMSDSGTDQISFGPDGNCGSLQYCNEKQACSSGNDLNCAGCQAQKQALTSIISTLRGIANQLVQADLQYRNFYYNSYMSGASNNDWGWVNNFCSGQSPPVSQQNCCVPSKSFFNTCQAGSANFPSPNTGKDQQSPNPNTVRSVLWDFNLKKSLGNVDFIQTATDFYTTQIKKGLTTHNTSNSSMVSKLTQAGQYGWIFAGGLYYTLAGANNATLSASIPNFTSNGPDLTNNPLSDTRNLSDAALVLVDVAGDSAQQNPQQNNQQSGSSGNGNCTPPSGASVSGISGKILSPAFSTGLQTYCFFDTATNPQSSGGGSQLEAGLGVQNPLLTIQHIGQALLIAAGDLFLLLVGLLFGVGLAGNFTPLAWGFGVFTGIGSGATLASFVIIPVIFAILGMLISVGALLAVYTPLVPYIIFTVGALGWLLSTIEAMIAGPLVALGILSPGGQHDLLGRSEPALGLLFGIFLRPSLMVFGLVAGMLLSSIVVYMINQMFWGTDIGVVHMIMVGTPSSKAGTYAIGGGGLLEFFIFLGAYVMLIVTVINKSFAAIHIIPDRVMGWIGIQGAQGYGFEGEAVEGVRTGGGAVVGAAGGAVSSGQAAGKGMAEARGKPKTTGPTSGVENQGGSGNPPDQQ